MGARARGYPAIARRFPELRALQEIPVTEADAIRTEAYKSLYDKLPIQERVFANKKIEELKVIMPNVKLGNGSAWELVVALAQLFEWVNWPERK